MSLPTWERGLKCWLLQWFQSAGQVAPYMGAWIEISNMPAVIDQEEMSLPTWERGLKYTTSEAVMFFETSLPTWERG